MKTFPQAMGHCSLMTVKCNSISDACKLRCPLCISLPRVVSVYIFGVCSSRKTLVLPNHAVPHFLM